MTSMTRKNGLISVVFGIIGIIFFFLIIFPIAASEHYGFGITPYWILYFSIELIVGILTVGLGLYGRTTDKSKSASITGLVIGLIIIVAWILAFLWKEPYL